MDSAPLAELATWLAEPLSTRIAQSIDRLRAADGVTKVCLMPDVHLANEVCVGAVVATEGVIYPQAVGGDIGCGMAALRFNVGAEAVDNERAAGRVLAGLYRAVPPNKHPQAKSLPELLRATPLSHPKLAKLATREGAVQLGTLGRGNHFLELQADEADQLWVMVHSGSRAMGQAIAAHHASPDKRPSHSLEGLDADTARGQAYLQDVVWGRAYAAENRLAMLQAIEALLDRLFNVNAEWDTLIHADHNHVQMERHGGRDVFVHRKGAQSARTDEAGVIPGSMGSHSFHTVGRGCAAALESCSHGAGRRLSRSDARHTISAKAFRQQVGRLWYDHRSADRLRDESPGAYKDIREVMRAQRELTKVVRTLRPVLNYK